MDDRQKQAQGNSFLFGVIIGVLITLLFTTKRGRALAKEVLEKGIHKFADLEKILQEMQTKEPLADEFDDEPEGNDYVPEAKVVPEAVVSQTPEPEVKPTPAIVKKHTPEVKLKPKVEPRPEPKPAATPAPTPEKNVEKPEAKPAVTEEDRKLAAESPLIEKQAETVSSEPVEVERIEINDTAEKLEEDKPRRWFRGLRKKK